MHLSSVMPRVAVWGVVALLAVAVGALVAWAARNPETEPPALPLATLDVSSLDAATAGSGTADPLAAAGVPGAAAAGATANRAIYAPTEDLAVLGGSAPAYRLGPDPTHSDVRRLAAALGIDGAPTQLGDYWRVEGDHLALEVARSDGSWSARPPAGAGAEPGGEPGAGAGSPAGADPPTEAEARRIALEVLEASGAPVAGATVEAANGLIRWAVTAEPAVGGLPAPGLGLSVAVGPDGRIESAMGVLGQPRVLGDYPLVDTPGALGRINHGWLLTGGMAPGRAGAGAGAALPPEVSVTGAELVLLAAPSWDGSGGYLVPGYRFAAEDGSAPTVTALSDFVLAPPGDTEPAPPPAPGDPGQPPAPDVTPPPAEQEEEGG